MKLSPIADDLAKRLKRDLDDDWDQLRIEVDILTGGEHPTGRLDRLTDMVKRRLPTR